MSIIDEIRDYEKKVFTISCKITICPKCDEDHESFKLHEVKGRLFYIITLNVVKKVKSCLARWKCPLCKATFIEYPHYAVPYKRYTKDSVLELGLKYVEDASASYRSVAKDGTITHEEEKNKDEVSSLSHTTVWRWLSFLGSLTLLARNALEMIRQKSAVSIIFREVFVIPPKKYRSKKRKQLLEQSLRLFNIDAEFTDIFGQSIFPHFATRESWC